MPYNPNKLHPRHFYHSMLIWNTLLALPFMYVEPDFGDILSTAFGVFVLQSCQC
jgi:hypothetical protein